MGKFLPFGMSSAALSALVVGLAAFCPASALADSAVSTDTGASPLAALNYVDVASEANVLTVSTNGSDAVTFDDSVPITPGSGCSHPGGDNTVVTCLASDFEELTIDLGPGTDSVTFSGDFANSDFDAGFFGGGVWLLGGDDNDVLGGTNGDDFIDGGPGDDTESGGGGGDQFGPFQDLTFDLIAPEDTGADTYSGNGGSDVVTYGGRSNSVSVTEDSVANDGETGEHDNVSSDVEVVVGGSEDDTLDLSGSAAPGAAAAGGGDGNDTIIGTLGADQLVGGAGNDTINAGGGNDQVSGDDGDDVIDGGNGDDQLSGGDGNDTLAGDSDSDTIDPGAGDDHIDGGPDDDILEPSAGNDTMTGGAGNDGVEGGDGNDALDGGAGDDAIDGGNGADTITSSDGVPDDVRCGEGTDAVAGDSSDTVAGDCETVTGARIGGPPGPAGAAGPQGAPGPQGSQGRQGPPGRIELVTCKTVTRKVRKRRAKRQVCKAKLVSGPVKFRSARAAHAALTRRRTTYARGSAISTRAGLELRLIPRRPLRAGRYTLTLTAAHRRTTRRTIVLR